ncbi:MAG: hypothetical protein IM581_11625 [Chitinophagaceae bacterium]|nr:hypothetical protein [Chitinophagaceae bacterium]
MRLGLMAIWVIWLLITGNSSAAQVYRTQAGTVLASGKYMGAGVTGVSNHLFMHLNYDRAEMHLRLVISTIKTENDSLNMLLQKLTGHELIFTGKMNIAFVQTKNHPKQKFATQGMLFLNGIGRAFSFSSVLEHFPRGNASCILSGEFIVDLKQFNIGNLLPGEEKVIVKFNQLVLKKSVE